MVVVIEIPTVIQYHPIGRIIEHLCEKIEEENPGENIVTVMYCEKDKKFNYLENKKCREKCWKPVRRKLSKKRFKILEKDPELNIELLNEKRLAIVYQTDLTDYEKLLETRIKKFNEINDLCKQLGQKMRIYIVYGNDLGTKEWNRGTRILADVCTHYDIWTVTIPKSTKEAKKNWKNAIHGPKAYGKKILIESRESRMKKEEIRRKDEMITSCLIGLIKGTQDKIEVSDEIDSESLREVAVDYAYRIKKNMNNPPTYNKNTAKGEAKVKAHKTINSFLGDGDYILDRFKKRRDLKMLLLECCKKELKSYVPGEVSMALRDEIHNYLSGSDLDINVESLLNKIYSDLPDEIKGLSEYFKVEYCRQMAALEIASIIVGRHLIPEGVVDEMKKEITKRFEKIDTNTQKARKKENIIGELVEKLKQALDKYQRGSSLTLKILGWDEERK